MIVYNSHSHLLPRHTVFSTEKLHKVYFTKGMAISILYIAKNIELNKDRKVYHSLPITFCAVFQWIGPGRIFAMEVPLLL